VPAAWLSLLMICMFSFVLVQEADAQQDKLTFAKILSPEKDILTQRAEAGSGFAQYFLGRSTSDGKTDETNPWFVKMIKNLEEHLQGYPSQFYLLGVAYTNGFGIKKDAAKGERYLSLAYGSSVGGAQLDNPDSIATLGAMYYNQLTEHLGIALEMQNDDLVKKAYYWLRKGVQTDGQEAILSGALLGGLMCNQPTDKIKDDYELLVKVAQKHKEFSPELSFAMACVVESNAAFEDLKKSNVHIKMFKAAASKGHAAAKEHLKRLESL